MAEIAFQIKIADLPEVQAVIQAATEENERLKRENDQLRAELEALLKPPDSE